jgi:hypothetical protein
MTYDIGSTGQIILLGFAFGFGAIAQLILGRSRSSWLWLAGAVGWAAGAIFASEVLFATATVDEIQPIIDGLAFDEALLGGLIGGVVLVAIAWLVARPVSLAEPRVPRQTMGPKAV